MRAFSTDLRSGSSSRSGSLSGVSGASATDQPFLVPGGGGTPGRGGGAPGRGGGGGGTPLAAGSRSSSDSTCVMLARLPSRLEIGGVTRCGPPRRPGGSGAGVGERGTVPPATGGASGGNGVGVGERGKVPIGGVGVRGKVPTGAAVGGGGTPGTGGAASCGGQGAALSAAIGSGGGVGCPSIGAVP